MKKDNIYPYILVTIQLSCLFFIAVSGPLLSDNTGGMLMESAGVFLALLAIYTIKVQNINIAPIVKQNSKLVTSGPYRIIRHPMYIAQLLAVLPLVTDYFSWYRLAAILILLVTLLVKVEYEEKQLLNHFEGYAKYQKTTKKLIPFIY